MLVILNSPTLDDISRPPAESGEAYFVDRAIQELEFFQERIDMKWPGDAGSVGRGHFLFLLESTDGKTLEFGSRRANLELAAEQYYESQQS